MSLDMPYPTGRAGRKLDRERAMHAERLRRQALAGAPVCPDCALPMTLHPNGNFYECPNHFTDKRCSHTVRK